MRKNLSAAHLVAASLALAACTATPYDFPQPTMVGNERGYSMTGFMATSDPEVVRERLTQRMRGSCPDGLDFVDLTTHRADNAVGTKILRYEAVVKCDKSGGGAPTKAT